MFTGIITGLGHIVSQQSIGGDIRLSIATPTDFSLTDVQLGDSIAVNGVCLTVVAINDHQLSFDVSTETITRTSLGGLQQKSAVNLEKALAVGQRLGGHFVSGHVDGMAECIQREQEARSIRFRFAIAESLQRYITEKGSICIDGVSLTINKADKNGFEVNIIPHTMQETIIASYQVGTRVNIEVDLIARYLEKLLSEKSQHSELTMATLQQHGFISS